MDGRTRTRAVEPGANGVHPRIRTKIKDSSGQATAWLLVDQAVSSRC